VLTIRHKQVAAIVQAEIAELREQIASGLLSSGGGPRLDRTEDEVRQLVAAAVERALREGLDRRSTVIRFVESFVSTAPEVIGHEANAACLEALVREYEVRELLRMLESAGAASSGDAGTAASQVDID
jgi:hypothetical protein